MLAVHIQEEPIARIEVAVVEKESKSPETVAEVKKAPVVSKLSKGNFRSPHSIDEILNAEKSKDSSESDLLGGDDMPKTPFGQEQLDECWNLFVSNHIDKKNRSLYTTLKTRTPDLKSHFKLIFQIENHVQLNQIDAIKVDLVNYLRKHLNNYSITFETPVKKNESKVHIFSDEEKYKLLAKKYPLLETLREKLDLDLTH